MTKNEKSAAKSSGAKPAGEEAAPNRTMIFLIGAVALAALVGGVVYWRSSSDATPVATGEKRDVDVALLMTPGPLEDISLGKAEAPITIVEYASMTCSHCANFHEHVLPELEQKYIDSGQVRLILREFPLDGLAVAAFMLARCAGPDRYYPMVDALFETQKTWAMPGSDGKEKLLVIAKQAGFSKEKFDQCLADKELFDKIVETRKIAHEKFGVESTPSFFVNGKRLKGDHQLKDFEAVITGGTAPVEGEASPAGDLPSEAEETAGE